jgi:hypothetical protein
MSLTLDSTTLHFIESIAVKKKAKDTDACSLSVGTLFLLRPKAASLLFLFNIFDGW